jgi:phage tail protein X
MATYTTKQGDMWDSISFTQLGTDRHTDKLMDENLKYYDHYIFPAGIVLNLPDIEPDVSEHLPPWRRVEG